MNAAALTTDPMVLILGVAGLVLVLVLTGMGLMLRALSRRRAEDAAAQANALMQAQAQTQTLASHIAQLGGRLTQLAEGQSHMARQVEERLDKVSQRMGASLEQSAEKTALTMASLQERLALIDQAQKNITELSGQVVGLQDILANKQARGAFGEIQMADIVTAALPPSAYSFQTTMGNGKRADCLVVLPNPPGPIVVDAKFPLESYSALRNAADDAARAQAERGFRTDVLHHVKAIAERYIIPGETAESALMFLPSEAVYAELHANFRDVVEKSYQRRVWIVSPTTLMATLNTVRAVLKDARMREQAGVIQKEVLELIGDVTRLQDRVDKLKTHFTQAEGDIRQIDISTGKIVRRAERIEEVQLGDGGESLPETRPDVQSLFATTEDPG